MFHLQRYAFASPDVRIAKSERALGVLEERHFFKEGAAFREHSVRRCVRRGGGKRHWILRATREPASSALRTGSLPSPSHASHFVTTTGFFARKLRRSFQA